MDNALMLGAFIVKSKLEEFKHFDKKALARKSFELACDENNTWYATSEDLIFRIGCGALLLILEGEDKYRFEQEIQSLNALSVAVSGVPVDFESVLGGIKPEDFIGVLGIFREVYAASDRS